MKILLISLSVLISTFLVDLYAQNYEAVAGSFLVRNYSSKEHGGNAQIFDAVQDSRGVMYFGNQRGVLEYDGVSWRTIFISKDEKRVHSLEVNAVNQVFVGGDGDFGMLKNDSSGQIYFKSLLKESGIDSIGEVFKISTFNNEIALRADRELLVLKDNQLLYRSASESYVSTIKYVKGVLYVGQKDKGVFTFQEGELKLIENGDFFKDFSIMDFFEIGSDVFVVTSANGIYKMNNSDLPLKVFDYVDYTVLSSLQYKDEIYLGTFGKGTKVYNTDFELIAEAGVDKGTSDATVKCQFVDREGNYWAGTNLGITKISINEPIRMYGKMEGLTSGVEFIERYNNVLHFATQNGVFAFDSTKINKTKGIERDCYSARTFVFGMDTLMFVAGFEDVFTVNKNGEVEVIGKGGPYDFHVNPLNSSELIVLHYDGISCLEYTNGKFIEKSYIKSIANSSPFNFIIEDDGTIWIGTLDSDNYGVFKSHVDSLGQENPVFEKFGEGTGLTKGASYLFMHEDKIYVANDRGLFSFSDGQFNLTNEFGFDFVNNHTGVHRINKDSDGNIWMVLFDSENNYQYGYASKKGDVYKWNNLPFLRYSNEIVHSIFHDKEGVSWLGGPGGLLRYDRYAEVLYDGPFDVVLRSVRFGEEIVYKGTNLDGEPLNIVLEYSSNKAIGFEFSSTSFIDEDQNLYSYYMEGHDDDWSEWSNRTIKEYNLDYGEYTFHVKSKNIYGYESKEATYTLKILPPWYKTAWAYALYVLVFILIVYGLIRLSLYRVRQKNIQLEKIVDERTQEVVVQKEEAEKQRDEAEKQKHIANEQKLIVEEKNREIVDSINYAKRIQEAIMPSIEELSIALPDGFLLYMPKDVVAGDFFWMEKIDDVVYYAAADCTGHGVPGAMVSVVCSNALTKALYEDGIRETGSLLDRTREIVVEILARSGDEVKDGMDISLCALNLESKELQWSGANNSLWILRKDASEIEETKPDKQPIGLFDRATPFTTHNIKMNEGDLIYIFTDGYQDQFGGEKGKKFKPSAVRKLLLANSQKTMNEQRQILHDTIIEWMNELEQVDDICIMGVRV